MDGLKVFDANPSKQFHQEKLTQDCCIRVCELCLRKTDMPILYEDDNVWISYGKKSQKVIVVWKEHRSFISDDEDNLVAAALYKAFPLIRKFNIKRCHPSSLHWYCTVTNISCDGVDSNDDT